jgi:hypothetical protein
MLTTLILVVFAVVVLVLVLLVVVVIAIRQEPRDMEMRNEAPSLTAVIVRRLLGVYLRRPTPPADSAEECSPDTWPTAGWTEPTTLPQARGGERPLQAYTVEQVAKMLHIGRDRSTTYSGPASCAA